MTDLKLTPTARLAVDQLERRDTPAGNVSVFVSGGQIFVSGDAADNQVSVRQNSLGDFTVVGLSGTTVNGVGSVYLGRGFAYGLRVAGGFGTDQIELAGTYTTGPVSVFGGDGGDGIVFNGVTAGSLAVDAGTGNDLVVTNGVQVFGAADVSGGFGGDTLQYRGLTAGGGVLFRDFEAVG